MFMLELTAVLMHAPYKTTLMLVWAHLCPVELLSNHLASYQLVHILLRGKKFSLAKSSSEAQLDTYAT